MPRYRYQECHDIPTVQDEAVAQSGQKAIAEQNDGSQAGTMGTKPFAQRKYAVVCQYAGNVSYQSPGIHLPGRPRSLSEKEVGAQRRKCPHHEAAVLAEHRSGNDADGADWLEVGNGCK